MGHVLHRGLLQGQEPVGVPVVGAETCVDNELVEAVWFPEGHREGFGKKVLG